MTCERTILECSLTELTARRKLKDFSRVEVLKIEDDILPKRRPYLSKSERELANELPESVLKEYFRAGEFVHIPMTREERLLIEQFKKFNKKSEFSDEDLTSISE